LPTYWISHGDSHSARSNIPLFLLLWLHMGSSLCSATTGNVEKFTAENIKYCQACLWHDARNCHFDMCKVTECKLNFTSVPKRFWKLSSQWCKFHFCTLFTKNNCLKPLGSFMFTVCVSYTHTHAHSCRPYLFIHSFIYIWFIL
jgi:hypothetical protein